MRLPADVVLLIVDAQRVVVDPHENADDGPAVETNIAALIAAWRAERLPLAHVGRPASDVAASPALVVSPLDGEIVTVRSGTSAFDGADLEARLDELGATTLVFCGALAAHALEASVRDAGDLGYQVFVVADACQATDGARGRIGPEEDLRALSRASPRGEGATIVDVATALRAASTAKARQRRAAART
jgi:nicotinamidase-related amidase